MIIPTVHPNGTPKRDLMKANLAAQRALAAAMDALTMAGPNGRDFYPQGTAAWGAAQAEHGARMDALRGVLLELDAMFTAIDDQGAA